MKTKIPKIINIIIATTFFLTPSLAFLSTSAVYADANDICNQPVAQAIKEANGCGGGSTAELKTVITDIISAVIGILGIVAAIFIVVGGVNYMTSAGDPGKIEKAKKTILWAVVGLIIASLTFVIVNFVVKGLLNQ